ncbi:hypothetical protein ACQ4WX_09110 [Streptomyces lasalocidi]
MTAGADHVAVQVIGVEPGESALPHWRLLAEALLPTPPRAHTVSGRSGPAVRA